MKSLNVRNGSLRGSALLGRSFDINADPRSSTVNMMDLILVLFVATLLLAISQGNIDMNPEDPDVKQIEKLDSELTEVSQGISNSDAQFAEVGTVYADVETGELYVVAPNGEGQ